MLTDLEREMLAFEGRAWRPGGAKEVAVAETFGLSMTRYVQVLNGLLGSPAALAEAPVLVHRLRRRREAVVARWGGREVGV